MQISTRMAIDEQKLLKGFAVILLLAALTGAFLYTFQLYRESQKKITELSSRLEQGRQGSDDAGTVEKVGKHILLPDEQPKVVVVQNAETLKKEQPFFSRAKDGDILLVYSTRVILYNPEIDKIIEIAQIRPDAASPGIFSQSPTPSIRQK